VRRKLVLMVAFVTMLTGGVSPSAVAEPYVATCLRSTDGCGPPRLTFDLGVTVTPKRLPKRTPAPVAVRIKGKIPHTVGVQPQALREVLADIDRGLTLNATDLPACPRRRLEVHHARAARRACGDSIVGEGLAHVAIESVKSEPVQVPLIVFYGGTRDGKTTLSVWSPAGTSAPEPIIATMRIVRKPSGPYGLHAVARVPVIADGQGSLVDFDLEVARVFEARCPAGVLKVSFPKILFRNETRVPSVASQTVLKGGLAVPCTPERSRAADATD
jgi:hypothetical protein